MTLSVKEMSPARVLCYGRGRRQEQGTGEAQAVTRCGKTSLRMSGIDMINLKKA